MLPVNATENVTKLLCTPNAAAKKATAYEINQ